MFNKTLSVFRRITIVIAIAAAFLFGLATTVYLSLRSPEVTVPDVLGKDRFEAENVLGHTGLNFRVRASRPSNQVKPDTVLFQLPRAGEVVKVGQTVAMDISRATKEGEAPEVVTPPEERKPETTNANANANTNRPSRPKNTNKNVNENANGNTNRNVNANRSTTNGNENTNKGNNTNSPAGSNVNRTGEGKTTNSNSSENANRRPAPKPSPTPQ
ncbi:MAG TPA: PASTA domain-containing protein [Pyrinomonadaceae bacterium]